MQLWLIENPIRAYFAADKLQPNVNPRHTSESNIRSVLEAARARSQSGQVAQHLVGAKLAMRFPDQEVSNHSYSTADVPTGRPGDFVLGSTVFHVTVAAISSSLMRKCRQNVRNNYRVVLLVPDGNREGARQWASSENLGDTVEVAGLETFIGQNVDEMAGFNQGQFENRLRQLLEIYNQRVRDAEPDPSLEIEIPANMSRRRGRS
jgi:hypothetical protein